MKKIHPWEANDLAGDYEERGFHPTKWEEVTEFDEEGYGWVCTDNGWGFVNQEGYLVIPDDYQMIQYPFFENGYCIAKNEKNSRGLSRTRGNGSGYYCACLLQRLATSSHYRSGRNCRSQSAPYHQ